MATFHRRTKAKKVLERFCCAALREILFQFDSNPAPHNAGSLCPLLCFVFSRAFRLKNQTTAYPVGYTYLTLKRGLVKVIMLCICEFYVTPGLICRSGLSETLAMALKFKSALPDLGYICKRAIENIRRCCSVLRAA